MVVSRKDEASRRESVHGRVKARGAASVRDLAGEFGVSAVTMRRDLAELERRGLLQRVHGGAIRTASHDEGSFSYRLTDAVEAKQDIARRAARLVHNRDAICLDSSSTAYYLATELLQLRGLFVVTNSIPTATLFLEQSNATIYLTGGVLRRASRATITVSVHAGFTGTVDKGFFGLNGISAETGLSEISLEEAESKRELATFCRHIYVLVDAAKFGAFGLHSWLPPDRITGLFTDAETSAAALAPWRKTGTRVDTGRPTRGGIEVMPPSEA